MALLAVSTLILLVPQPQGATDPDKRLEQALSKSDISSLNKKAQDWIQREIEWEQKGARARKKRDKARSGFMKQFQAKGKSKKVDLLKNVGDLLGIFDNAFPYKRVSTSGELKKFTGKATYPREMDVVYQVVAPKKYDPKKAYRTVVVLAGREGDKWTRPKDYFEKTWKGSAVAADTFFLLPEPRPDFDYNTMPDLSTNEGEATEAESISGVLFALGEMQRMYRLDRTRMILDCGVGNCGFGLRLATYFPDRFAGIILREPVMPKDLRLDSLRGVPILLVSSDNTKAACDAIQKAMDAVMPEMVTIVKASDAAPFKAATPELATWMEKVRRQMFPTEVVVAPNHDRFKRGHWVSIDAAEPLESGNKPIVKVRADKEKNRVVITSEHVSAMGLLLNDALVDLDKEVVFVINGKEIKGNKFPRSMRTLETYMRKRFDPTSLYTAFFQFEVPKE